MKGHSELLWHHVASEITKNYWAHWDSLCLKDGVLYQLWETPQDDQVTWQLILYQNHYGQVSYTHNTPRAGQLAWC